MDQKNIVCLECNKRLECVCTYEMDITPKTCFKRNTFPKSFHGDLHACSQECAEIINTKQYIRIQERPNGNVTVVYEYNI